MTRPLWKIITLILAVMILIVAVGIFILTGPEREVAQNPFMNAISQQTNKWDTRVDLTPTPLKVGASFEDVGSKLSSGDFILTNEKISPTIWIPKDSPALKNEDLRQANEIAYILDHGDFVCNKRYIVFLKFDESKKLSSAEGMIRGLACL